MWFIIKYYVTLKSLVQVREYCKLWDTEFNSYWQIIILCDPIWCKIYDFFFISKFYYSNPCKIRDVRTQNHSEINYLPSIKGCTYLPNHVDSLKYMILILILLIPWWKFSWDKYLRKWKVGRIFLTIIDIIVF
jgi:hypothetical protein